jgi:hypothetical protein
MKKKLLLFAGILALAAVITAFSLSAAAANGVKEPEVRDDFGIGEFFTEKEILDAFGGLSERERADFGGLYIDGDRNVVITFAAGSEGLRSARERAAKFDAALESADGAMRQKLVIREVRFGYDELWAVRDAILDIVKNDKDRLPALGGFGVQYDINRVKIGVRKNADINRLKQQLNELIRSDVPEYADTIEEIVYFVPAENEYRYLSDVTGITYLRYTTPGFNHSVSAAVKYTSSTWGAGFITTRDL